MKTEKTNILLLFTDQMRWDCIGAAGNQVIKTPNLDRLASEGVLFENAYSTAPLCTPARAQVMTGRACWDSGVWALGDKVPASMRTFAHEISDQGYFTGAVGKMHFKPMGGGGSIREPHGFQKLVLSEEIPELDEFYEDDYTQYLITNGYNVGRYTHGRRSPDYGIEGYHPQTSEMPLEHFDTTWTGNETIKMLEGNADRPFMIWSSFVKPHFPCELPKDWPCPYKPEDIPLRMNYKGKPDIDSEKFQMDKSAMNTALEARWLEEKTLREFAAYYYANITLVDMQVGRILNRLEELGLRENTLVIFASDHGENLGEHHILGKANFYDESTKIPMIVSGPMVAAPGRVDSRPVILEDLCPTIIDAADGNIPDNILGKSILPLLKNTAKPGRDKVFGIMGGTGHFEHYHAHCFIRSGKWKYMYQFNGGQEKLFDMEADPLEINDISAQSPEECERLNRELANCFKDNGAHWLVHHQTGKLKRNLK
jgi:arylsulfatase A-like enzyme